ncbi:MAG: ferric reductase [Burkholderiales bacterium]|nr:MAG: ferric reductase [Burkholderiales bacterium]
MRNLKRAFWALIALPVLLWLVFEPAVFRPGTFFALRGSMMQLTGVVAIACMSVAMVLALRPRWPEARLGGLDKMYRMHKWLGIASLVAAVLHWLWAQAPKWAVGWGWIERPTRGARPAPENSLAAFLSDQRGTAESWGEWAFYGFVVLIALALIPRFPYKWFYKSHRLLAVAWLVLVFHTVVLMRFHYWTTPIGWLVALLLVYGTWAAVVVLMRRVGATRQVPGTITSLRYYPGVKALEIEAELRGWPGHRPGQFAFATSDITEGAHPYTIASSWRDGSSAITFVAKELGDHTSRLREKLHVGQALKIEGPYGCFTFDDDCPRQIWIAGGIGITPFIGRMQQMASQKEARAWPVDQKVDLFHATADVDEDALDRLAADARSADVRLHVLIDARDGLLTGERIRAAVPDWREASVWFCGPSGFGEAITQDLARHGFPVEKRFHQELFAMR